MLHRIAPLDEIGCSNSDPRPRGPESCPQAEPWFRVAERPTPMQDSSADLALLQQERDRLGDSILRAHSSDSLSDHQMALRNVNRMIRDLDKTRLAGPSNMFEGPQK